LNLKIFKKTRYLFLDERVSIGHLNRPPEEGTEKQAAAAMVCTIYCREHYWGRGIFL